MRGFMVVLMLSALALAGCTGGTPLDYSARLGKPEVTVESRKMALADFMPEAACKNCVGGADPAKVQVTVPVEHLSFPAFPAGGREVACTVASVPWTYPAIQAATVSPRTFVWSKDAVIELRACQQAAAGDTQCYDLTVDTGDTHLPAALAPGDKVTLRFLPEGKFFDVKEWSVAGPVTRLQPLPRG